MAMMQPETTGLPRSIPERLVFGFLSLAMAIFCGMSAIAVFFVPHLGTSFGWILVIVTEELLVATTFVGVLGVIWAIAMREWVERMFHSATKKLMVAIVLGFLPIVILFVLACFGIRIGDVQ